MPTRQQLFSKIARHLIKQNKKSLSEVNGLCSYRGDSNLKCAIGALIPNDMYKSGMECGGIYELTASYPELTKFFGGKKNNDFLSGLQFIHDSFEPFRWRTELQQFAKKNKLKFPHV